MQTVLVTAIGSFSSDVVIRRLKELGYRVVGCNINPAEWIAESLEVDAFYRVPRVSDEAAFIENISEICAQESVDYIFPLTDVEVDFFNAHRDIAFGHALVCISSAEAINICRDKARMAEFLKTSKSGVQGIPGRPLAECLAESFSRSVVCKPVNGRSSEGLARCFDADAWEGAKKVACPENYIVQPLIEGPVITVDVVRGLDGSGLVAVPRKELLRTLNGAGMSVYVFNDTELVQRCCALADELGIVGCVNFEFIQSAADGEYYFLECNPRFSGGVAFTCKAAYDCVENHLHAFKGEPIAQLSAYASQYIARKNVELITKTEED